MQFQPWNKYVFKWDDNETYPISVNSISVSSDGSCAVFLINALTDDTEYKRAKIGFCFITDNTPTFGISIEYPNIQFTCVKVGDTFVAYGVTLYSDISPFDILYSQINFTYYVNASSFDILYDEPTYYYSNDSLTQYFISLDLIEQTLFQDNSIIFKFPVAIDNENNVYGSVTNGWLNEDDEIGYALSHMKEKNVHRAPVVDNKNNLSGIISLIDLFTDYYLVSRSKGIRLSRASSHQKGKRGGFGIGEKQDLLKLPLKNIMTNHSECCCCSGKTIISEVIELMNKDSVSSVVIVEKNKPVGIITFKDILMDFAKR